MELQLHDNLFIVSGNNGSSEVSDPEHIRDFNCLNLERLFDFVNLLHVIVIVSSVSSKLSRYAFVADENLGRHDILLVKLFLDDKKEYSSFYFNVFKNELKFCVENILY